MGDEMDFYISRCLKNWTARKRPPSDGKARLLDTADSIHITQDSSSLARYLASFANRWASPGEQYYNQRHWQVFSQFTQSNSWSFLLATNRWQAN